MSIKLEVDHNGHIPVYLLEHVLLKSTISVPLTFDENFPSLAFLIVRTVHGVKELSHSQGRYLSPGPAVSRRNAEL